MPGMLEQKVTFWTLSPWPIRYVTRNIFWGVETGNKLSSRRLKIRHSHLQLKKMNRPLPQLLRYLFNSCMFHRKWQTYLLPENIFYFLQNRVKLNETCLLSLKKLEHKTNYGGCKHSSFYYVIDTTCYIFQMNSGK